MLRSRHAWTIAVTGLAVLAAGSCSGPKVTIKPSAELDRYQVRSLALVPFTSMATPQVRDSGDLHLSPPQSVRRSDISMSVPFDAERSPAQMVTVPGHASEKVTQLFWNQLRTREGLHVLPPSAAARVLPNGAPAELTLETAAEAARRLNTDAALIGEVTVFQERVGSRLGASPPASVGFEVRVVAPDGQVLWVGSYYERQRPMNEDILGFLQRWGAFVTADELAEYGVKKVLEEFPFGSPGK